MKENSTKRQQELDQAKALREDILRTYRMVLDSQAARVNYLRPCIPLEDQEPIDVDRTQLVTYTLKIRPGGGNDHTYKKVLRLFSDGSVSDWIDTTKDIAEIWTQNSVNGPHDKAAIVKTVLRDEALSHFENALEDLRQGPNGERVEFTADTVNKAMEAVAQAVFPHRALETQKLWMKKEMKKPRKMRYRTFQARVHKMNKYLPYFPGASEEDKFKDKEMLEILEFSLPEEWREEWDTRRFIATQHDFSRLTQEAEAMERKEANKANKAKQARKPEKRKKMEHPRTKNSVANKKTKGNNKFCSEHGWGNHASADCWTLHPELVPEKYQKKPPAKGTTKKEEKNNKKTKEMMLTIPKKAKKTKKVPKTPHIEESDSNSVLSVAQMERNVKLAKEERIQRYQAKMAQKNAEDSNSE